MLKATCPIFWPSHFEIFFIQIGKNWENTPITYQYTVDKTKPLLYNVHTEPDIQLNKLRQSNFI